MTFPIGYVAAAVLVAGSLFGSFQYGVSVGVDRETATQSRIDKANAETMEAAQAGAAKAISEINVVHQTIRGQVHREIQTNTVYRDCIVPADGVRIANDALSGKRTISLGGGELPNTDTTGR